MAKRQRAPEFYRQFATKLAERLRFLITRLPVDDRLDEERLLNQFEERHRWFSIPADIRWRLQHVKEGLCASCNRKALPGLLYCSRHRKYYTKKASEQYKSRSAAA